ncbi:MAG: Asp-tRNA(Asn)/Glu-tRNA(Gln) amidotransferase subunit GatC [Gemmatimonas sp.]|jgi:aspartyl-tRNA(Asn)/glutamyl-tRNA(Gln) amidotransferase subunit C|uniref:Asp-tRNA(Asn)/Glu-tRNA(Gln) amidotransferase subunit GatC n=1 Tax=Gemmatimonas sp. TaxID=1962908 RepID=UPI00391F202D|nr:Asp-tRNA(Asn)/Glu-tRNA(Gln) amidotransferase subunit GatC [Gemmatimonadota bacterium]
MSVSMEDVRQLAQLARVGLDEEHIPTLVQELNGILGHMDALQRVDITRVPPTPPGWEAPLRDDAAPADALVRPRAGFAPAMRDGFFLVPRLATHGEQGGVVGDDEQSA